MKKQKYKFFEVAIMNNEYKVYVHIGDREKTNKKLCKYFGQEMQYIDNLNRGKTWHNPEYHPCIWVDDKLDKKTFSATLAHEAIHAVSYIMDYCKMDPRDTTGNEFLAHSVAAIMRKCL